MQKIANAPIQCSTRTTSAWVDLGFTSISDGRLVAPSPGEVKDVMVTAASSHRRCESILTDCDKGRRGLAAIAGPSDEDVGARHNSRAFGRLESHNRCSGRHQNRLLATVIGDSDLLGSALLSRGLDGTIRHRAIDVGPGAAGRGRLYRSVGHAARYIASTRGRRVRQ